MLDKGVHRHGHVRAGTMPVPVRTLEGLKAMSDAVFLFPERVLAVLKRHTVSHLFTWCTRGLLALGFLPSGLTKLLGNRFTTLSPDGPIGYFFEALYRSGVYWQFLGLCQMAAAILLLIPRTTTLGALVYFPIILNIFVVTVSLHFGGTPLITGLMLLGSIYLLCWDYDRLKCLLAVRKDRPEASPPCIGERGPAGPR